MLPGPAFGAAPTPGHVAVERRWWIGKGSLGVRIERSDLVQYEPGQLRQLGLAV